MGPRLLSRGKVDLDRTRLIDHTASMGPRLLSRGKGAGPSGGVSPGGLQWGRGC